MLLLLYMVLLLQCAGDMIEQRMDGLLPRPLPLPDNLAANAALLARLSQSAASHRPPFPFPAASAGALQLPPFLKPPTSLGAGSVPPGAAAMLASLPQLPEIRARLLGLQFPGARPPESPPQFSPPGFLGNFNFNRDGSDSPIDGKFICLPLLYLKCFSLSFNITR